MTTTLPAELVERARRAAQRNLDQPPMTLEQRAAPVEQHDQASDLDALVAYRVQRAITNGHPPLYLERWTAECRRRELDNEDAHPGFITRTVATLRRAGRAYEHPRRHHLHRHRRHHHPHPAPHPAAVNRVGSLFSGIGGIDLGLERAGWTIAWQCETDPYCRRVLARHWPDVPCYHDIRDLAPIGLPIRQRNVHPQQVDLLAGGFPCQPVSVAGRRLAQADARWLWPEFARCIRLLRPRYVLVENVPGLLTAGMGDVLRDLAELGFDAEWLVFGARDVGAPHRRDRVWIVAWRPDADSDGFEGRAEPHERATAGEPASHRDDAHGLRLALADADHPGCSEQRWPEPTPAQLSAAQRGDRWAVEPAVGRVADGVPDRVDRLRALGNAVVPACAEHLGRILLDLTP